MEKRVKHFLCTYPGLDCVIILLLLPPTIEHMRGGRVMAMLRALFLSSLPLLRTRWIRPTIQTAPVFPFSFHSVITIHHYGHRDDQSQTGTSCRAEDRRGNHHSFSSPSFPSSFLFANCRHELVSPPSKPWKTSSPLEQKKVLKKGLIRLCSIALLFLLFFPFQRFWWESSLLVEKFGVIPFQGVSSRKACDEWECLS